MNSTAIIYSRLTGDLGIMFRVAEYAGAPAIFNDRAPDDFQFGAEAVVVIAAPSDDSDAGTFTERVRAVTQEVRVYAKDTGSTAEIDDLARDIRDLFHLQAASLFASDGTVNTATATGPTAAPTTDPALIGRRVTVRLELQPT